MWPPPLKVDGEVKDRDIDEIALEVAEKALNEWGKAEGELLYLKRAPAPLYEKWKKTGVVPRNIDREIVEIMHRTHMGVDQDYKNLMKQGTRAALADGWGGSMLATDLQDVLFGTPYPLQAEANLGVMKEDHVNIIVHGHEPILSEMIVAMAQKPEMVEYAKSKGAKGIQLGGICCTANEIFQRHGVPQAGTYLQQELAIITGACDAMVVDIQCIFQNLANVAKCFHTKLITTHPIAKMEQDNVIHIEFDEHHALEDAEKIVKMAIDNFQNRGSGVMIPQYKASQIAGFGVESIQYHLGGTFRGRLLHPERQHHQRPHPRHRRRGGLQQRPHPPQRSPHPGGQGADQKRRHRPDHRLQRHRLRHGRPADPGIGRRALRPGLAEVCETVGIPPVLHLGSCVDNSRILLAATEVVKAGGLGKDICDLPAAGSAPGMDEREGHQHRPLLRRLRRLHGLRPAPAHLRRAGVP
jgi:carbon-monoxide dehydrogenase catalytic subunit